MGESMAESIMRTERMELETQGEGQMVDITGDVARMVASAGLDEGQVLLFCTGSTGGITTIEYEPGLIQDFPDLFDRIAPRDITYLHDETWHDGNGHSHCRHLILGSSETIPVIDGALALGQFQRLFVVELDEESPNPREILVQLMGV